MPFGLFIALWASTLLVPICVRPFAAWVAVGLGIGLPLAWFVLMPKTCMSGGFIAFPMAMIQVAFLIAWVGVGLRHAKKERMHRVPNPGIQRTEASRSAQQVFIAHWRLASAADADRWAE